MTVLFRIWHSIQFDCTLKNNEQLCMISIIMLRTGFFPENFPENGVFQPLLHVLQVLKDFENLALLLSLN